MTRAASDPPHGERRALALPGGRQIEYRDIGPRDGLPVLYHHGTPGASIEWRLLATPEELGALGIRLIAANRPGVGRSTLVADRRIVDWPSDVAALLDALDIRQAAVLGYSGGSPYALVTAARLPDRVSAVTIVSGVAPFDAPGVTRDIERASRSFLELSRRRPWLSRLVSSSMGLLAGLAPRMLVRQAVAALPPADAALMRDRPQVGRLFSRMVHEATHGSGHSAQLDTALMIGDWGFELADVQLPVRLWHGTEDRNAPPAMGQHLADQLPSASLTWLKGEGHITTPHLHGGAILADLAARARAPEE